MALWCVVLILVLSNVGGFVRSQTDSFGFISIDCGLSSNSTTIDSGTGLTYVSDDQFINTGVNNIVSSEYISNQRFTLLTVRSFPNGKKNCYTLRSLSAGSRYLVRVGCMYGNYDKLNKPPTFDLYFGVNFWKTVSLDAADFVWFSEIIAVATADYVQVCLVNKGDGTPFLSWLELRPLRSSIYEYANSSQSLVYHKRFNLGSSRIVRYPDDPYDRTWENYTTQDLKTISTTTTVKTDKEFETPSLVLQTAVVSDTSTSLLQITWNPDDRNDKCYVILHFCEIQNISGDNSRVFDIYHNGSVKFGSIYPSSLSQWFSYIDEKAFYYKVLLKGTTMSNLPPILNAVEIYIIRPVTEVPTHDGDVTAINAIKANYKIDKGWNGDPCVPTNLSWIGVSCTNDSSGISRITGLTVSSSGLTGPMISDFGNLKSLKKLDLSWNKLTGSMPSSLDQLTLLSLLDISGNDLTLSPGLQKKQQSGALTVINSNSSAPCTSNCKKKKSWIIITTVLIVLLMLIVGAVKTILCLRKRRKRNHPLPPMRRESHVGSNKYSVLKKNNNISENEDTAAYTDGTGSTNHSLSGTTHNNAENSGQTPDVQFPDHNSSTGNHKNTPIDELNIDGIKKLNYKELEIITNNFDIIIGEGGFGSVYLGSFNNAQVAVKTLSKKSSQGETQFLAEVENLTRVHHRHLVSLVGYCKDKDNDNKVFMALVYEYMQNGTLDHKLRDKARPLTWKQRLQIAYEAAQGLDYLHKFCNPPLVHRDIKTNNILLSSYLEAKIADFGLSRTFDMNAKKHLSTAVAGTAGYLDPDYYNSGQLTEKSDVFSFGIVILEIVTGQPPIIEEGPDKGSITNWVYGREEQKESIIDPSMPAQYDKNSLEKVITLAKKCTEQSPSMRPSMDEVVDELKASLKLENKSTDGTRKPVCYPGLVSQSAIQSNYPRNDNIVRGVPAPNAT